MGREARGPSGPCGRTEIKATILCPTKIHASGMKKVPLGKARTHNMARARQTSGNQSEMEKGRSKSLCSMLCPEDQKIFDLNTILVNKPNKNRTKEQTFVQTHD